MLLIPAVCCANCKIHPNNNAERSDDDLKKSNILLCGRSFFGNEFFYFIK